MHNPTPLQTFLAWFDTQPASLRLDLTSFTDFMLGANVSYAEPALAYQGETVLRCWLERKRNDRRIVVADTFLLRSFLNGFFFADLTTCWSCTPAEARIGVTMTWAGLCAGALSDAALADWFRRAPYEQPPGAPPAPVNPPAPIEPVSPPPAIPEEVQRRIVARWPAIGIMGTPQNLAFLAAFDARGDAEDPVDLADEIGLGLLFVEGPAPLPPASSN